MGVAIAMSPCVGCGQVIEYNPVKVPSVTDPRTGTREPICQGCVDLANPQRVANGLEPIVVLPGAYDACDESELED
jgi:Fe-S-cluster-containing dehydrogenase component